MSIKIKSIPKEVAEDVQHLLKYGVLMLHFAPKQNIALLSFDYIFKSVQNYYFSLGEFKGYI